MLQLKVSAVPFLESFRETFLHVSKEDMKAVAIRSLFVIEKIGNNLDQ